MRVVVALLLACFCVLATAASASSIDTLLSVTTGPADRLVQQQQEEWGHFKCEETAAAIRLACNELKLQVAHHKPPQDAEFFSALIHGFVACLVALVCATSFQAAWATKQLHSAQANFAAREAELLQRCDGIKKQAYEFAERLGSQPTTPDAGYRGAQRSTTTTPIMRVQSPPPAAGGAHDQAYADGQPRSAATTPPAPVSESSAPNLALLVVEASPAKDTVRKPNDQLACPTTSVPATSVSTAHGAKSPAGAYDKAGSLSPASGLPHQQQQPLSATSRSPHQQAAISPAGRYPSPQGSAAPTPAAASPQHLPAHVHAGSPAVGSVAPSPPSGYGPPSGYQGPPRPMPGSAQRTGMPAPGQQWTPSPQQQPQQQQQQQAMSCPPMPGGGGAVGTPYGPGMVPPGAAPHSAGQLGAAAVQPRGEEMMPPPAGGMAMGASTPAGPGGWVNASRGGGTPPPFHYGAMNQQQQQQFISPGLGGFNNNNSSPGGMPGMCTPATVSTTRTGSLTHVQSVHSIAGSCGGSVPPTGGQWGSSTTPGSSNTPRSASSATSGARPSSGGSRPALDTTVSVALIAKLDEMNAAAEQRKKRAQDHLAQKKEQAQRQGTPMQGNSPATTTTSPLRESIV